MKTKSCRRSILAASSLVVAALISGPFMLRWFEHAQVYHPDRFLRATGKELNRPFEEVFFSTSDGVKLHGWYFPADEGAARSRLAVLVCHGNAGNISDRLELCQVLLECGVNVFLFDYRGYGRSEGAPSEEGTYLDAQAAHRWLRSRGIAGGNIIAYGESLGGGVACELALREELGGVALQSTFTSIPDIGAELFPWLPVRLLSTIRYDSSRKLPRIRIPVMILHSREDEIVGFHHAQTNFAVANEPKFFCEIQGGHNGALATPGRIKDGVETLLRAVATAPSGKP
jgi:hypothetical protein